MGFRAGEESEGKLGVVMRGSEGWEGWVAVGRGFWEGEESGENEGR